MRADPVGQRLGPARLGVSVAGGSHHSDEDLRCSDLAGAPVEQFDRLSGVVDEQALAGGMRLPHGRRQPALPAAIELAPAAVAVAVGRGLPVLLPQQHQGDAGAAQLVMDVRPIRLGLAPHAALAAGAGIEHRLQHPVAQRCRQRPMKLRRRKPIEGHGYRAARNPQRSAIARSVAPHSCLRRRISRTRRIDTLSAGIGSPTRHGFDEHRSPPAQRSSDRHPFPGWPTSNRNGRVQIGIGGRLHSGISGRLAPESAAFAFAATMASVSP
jgi:hypothetical protein